MVARLHADEKNRDKTWARAIAARLEGLGPDATDPAGRTGRATNPELRDDEGTDSTAELTGLGIESPEEETGMTLEKPLELDLPPGKRPQRSDAQALKFREQFAGMTPWKQADPNLLSWISCQENTNWP